MKFSSGSFVVYLSSQYINSAFAFTKPFINNSGSNSIFHTENRSYKTVICVSKSQPDVDEKNISKVDDKDTSVLLPATTSVSENNGDEKLTNSPSSASNLFHQVEEDDENMEEDEAFDKEVKKEFVKGVKDDDEVESKGWDIFDDQQSPLDNIVKEENTGGGIVERIGKVKPEEEFAPIKAYNSLGAFLLQRKRIEESEMRKISTSNSTKPNGSKNSSTIVKENIGGVSLNQINVNATEVQREFDTALQKFANDAESTLASFMDTYNQNAIGEDSKKGSKAKKSEKRREINELEREKELLASDEALIKEVDESISIVTGSGSELGKKELLKDIEILKDIPSTVSVKDSQATGIKMLPLSNPQHISRIELDMRLLSVSIASSIETIEEWTEFCKDGGGILPLLECIRDGAKEIRQGPISIRGDRYDENVISLVEQREVAFEAACKATKALRDLCVISKPFSAVVTDSILRADSVWAQKKSKNGKDESLRNGIISDLSILLKHSADADKLYGGLGDAKTIQKLKMRGLDILNTRRQRRLGRQRCGLYVAQLLLAMSFASDKAVDRMRATSGFTDTVLSCSSYARKERVRRRWIRYPIEIMKRRLKSKKDDETIEEDPFLTAASVSQGLQGQIQGTSNQLLAAVGHNEWYPKTAGQRGLRILCLDGGGTRGITAISSMRSIVDALGGIEVCDAFDMIAGTSTGAIISFLVGLRRESSSMARKRYDKLIKRIFVKSALSTPMLLFTTATYDESPFNNVMSSILRDNSMLASRADPRVPLVFAISSKMSSTPTQLCLFRNYNYNGGEKDDAFVQSPIEAKEELGLPLKDDIYKMSGKICYDENRIYKKEDGGQGSRHPGSFRVLQRAALRATTAAPTVFKPVLMGGELYCDGGIVASNPAAVAIHEARTIFPNVPIELVVSCGTGAFTEEKSEPRIGWDGIIGQIVNSATDGEQIHYILEDILSEGSTARLGRAQKTKYFRFNPVVGGPDDFPIDGTDPAKLEELSEITTAYMNEPEQKAKLDEIVSILQCKKRGWKRIFSR